MKHIFLSIALLCSIPLTGQFIGKLEVICGPMFAGKSEELIRLIKRALIARQSVLVIKPFIDTRSDADTIASHNGTICTAHAVTHAAEILDLITQRSYDIVAIDEAQFFDAQIIHVVQELIQRGIRVIVAGLDLDHRDEPFGSMPTLLARADHITKLQSICTQCGADAHHSQLIINGAQHHDAVILIGGEESYQARCRQCYQAPEAD